MKKGDLSVTKGMGMVLGNFEPKRGIQNALEMGVLNASLIALISRIPPTASRGEGYWEYQDRSRYRKWPLQDNDHCPAR